MWGKARRLAGETPASRNRYVDLLRAVSIVFVVIGHWLIAAPVVRDGAIDGVNLLAVEPWTQWLTWVFQVMPVFFVVGGYSNAASWRATRSQGRKYGEWLGSRLRRLVLPAVPLVLVWSGFAVIARTFGVGGDLLRLGSQVALIPLWFLAVYVVVVALTPVTIMMWERWGVGSLAMFIALAVAVDIARFQSNDFVGWLNFVFVWAAVHQIGYVWRDGRIGGSWRRAGIGVVGLLALMGLVTFGPYPMSMVGVPGAGVTNNSPPTVALLALGIAQIGLLLAVERPVLRWLQRPSAWTATILVNGSIMTVYLWHLTAMVVVLGVAVLAGGFGLGVEPATATWWTMRPVWLGVFAATTLPFLAWFARFERPAPASPMAARHALLIVGLACLGFATIAGGGIANDSQWLRPLAVLPILAAGAVATRTSAPRGRPVGVAAGQ